MISRIKLSTFFIENLKWTILICLNFLSFSTFSQNYKWSTLGNFTNCGLFKGDVYCMTKDAQNNIYVGGTYTNGVGKTFVAKWNGSTWTEIGGVNNSKFNGYINTIAIDSLGNIYIAGEFTNANGMHYVAKWNGTSWNEVGGNGKSTFNNSINKLITDNNGNIYITGNFFNANGKYYISKWNGTSWSELGGTNTSNWESIEGMLLNSNKLYVIGSYYNSTLKYYVNVWNGTSWSELGGPNTSTFNSTIYSICKDKFSNLYVCGFFVNDSGYNYVAKWDGSSWSELGGKNSMYFKYGINNLCVDSIGNLYVCHSNFQNYPRSGIALWDGVQWQRTNAFIGSYATSFVTSLFCVSNNLYYSRISYLYSNKVCKWDGSHLYGLDYYGSPYYLDFNAEFTSMLVDSNNSLNAFIGKDPESHIWLNNSWNYDGYYYVYAHNISSLNAITSDNKNTQYAAGISKGNNSNQIKNTVCYKYNKLWIELGGINLSTFNGAVNTLVTDSFGNLYAAGAFTNSNGMKYVAKWDGSTWSEVGGTNASTFNNEISCINIDKKGNLYAAGKFTNASNRFFLAKWDGSNWIELGNTFNTTFNASIISIAIDTNAIVYVSGAFSNVQGYKYVAKWTGSAWIELGTTNSTYFNDTIFNLHVDKKGNLYAAGAFKNNSTGKCFVAKWTGTNWSELGGTNISNFNNQIRNLISDTLGNVYVSGKFTKPDVSYYTTYVAKYGDCTSKSFTEVITCINKLPFVWNGKNYYTTTIDTVHLINSNGCDSITILKLKVNNTPSSSYYTISVCANSFPFKWNNKIFNSSVTDTTILTNSLSCDSVVVLKLIKLSNTQSINSITLCPSAFPFHWLGKIFNTTITDTTILTNAVGCDSLVILKLTKLPSSVSITNLALCPVAFPFTWNGKTFTNSAIDTTKLTAANNCDSLVILKLTKLPTSQSVTKLSLCQSSFPFHWNGKIFNSSITDTTFLKNSLGCDSLVILILNKLNSSQSVYNISLCPSAFPFYWNKKLFYSSTTDTSILSNSVGCDSLIILNLTKSILSQSISNITLCSNEFPFYWNGKTYNSSAIDTAYIKNANSCDSMAILVLNKLLTSQSLTSLSLCANEFPFQWNGKFIYTSGIDSTLIKNAMGCDSLIILVIKKMPTSQSTTTYTICQNNLPFLWNNKKYSSATIDTIFLKNINNCDSLLILNLNVNPSPNTSEISGNPSPSRNESVTYTVNGLPGSIYFWNVKYANILSGLGTNSVDLTWNFVGTDTLYVKETSIFGCEGIEKSLTVNIKSTFVLDATHTNYLIRVYPNPSKDYFQIILPENMLLENLIVYDLFGKEILKSKHTHIDMSEYKSGVYVVKIIDKALNTYSIKLIKD